MPIGGVAPPSNPDGSAPAAPESAVVAAAQGRQFGPHVTTRRLPNPLLVFGGSLLVSLASLGLMLGVAWLGNDTGGPVHAVLRFFALCFCFLFVGALTFGLAALTRGAQSFHIFAGGFVYRRNGKIRTFAWPEVVELRPVVGKRGGAAGKVQHYDLAGYTGKPVSVPLVLVDGRDPFMDQLMAALHRNGIPVR